MAISVETPFFLLVLDICIFYAFNLMTVFLTHPLHLFIDSVNIMFCIVKSPDSNFGFIASLRFSFEL